MAGEFAKIVTSKKSKMQKVLMFSPGRALTVLAAGLGGLQADAQLKSNMVPDATAGACVCVCRYLVAW